MKVRLLFLAGLLAATTWLAFFADNSPVNDVVEPSKSAVSVSTGVHHVGDVAHSDISVLAILPRQALMQKGASGAEEARPRDLFMAQDWTPLPPPLPPAAPVPPIAPPLPFSFLGKKQELGFVEVYVVRGNDVLILREKEIIDDLYRIDRIKPPLLYLTYLPLKQAQTLMIGELE